MEATPVPGGSAGAAEVSAQRAFPGDVRLVLAVFKWALSGYDTTVAGFVVRDGGCAIAGRKAREGNLFGVPNSALANSA